MKNPQEIAREMTDEARAKVDRIRLIAKELNVPEKVVERHVDQLAYRKAYNQREEVKAARKVYNQRRNAELKEFRELAKSHPLLKELVG